MITKNRILTHVFDHNFDEIENSEIVACKIISSYANKKKKIEHKE